MKTALLTDLPPGLISSVGLASKGTLGSQVIICTDGESKGALNSDEYYRKIGEYAKEKGVTIHILHLQTLNAILIRLALFLN